MNFKLFEGSIEAIGLAQTGHQHFRQKHCNHWIISVITRDTMSLENIRQKHCDHWRNATPTIGHRVH